jgi:hypothetical protein
LKEEALDRIKRRNRFGRGCGPVVWQIIDDDDVDDDDDEPSRYNDSLRTGLPGNGIALGAEIFRTGPSAHPASCTIGTGSLLRA